MIPIQRELISGERIGRSSGCDPRAVGLTRNAARSGNTIVACNPLSEPGIDSIGGRAKPLQQRRRVVLILALGAIVVLPGLVLAQGTSPLRAEGRGMLKEFSPVTGEKLEIELQMANWTNWPATITRAEVLMACRGGWSITQGDMIAKEGTFFGGDPVLAAGGHWSYQFDYEYSIPITHYLLAVQVQLPGGAPEDYSLAVPFRRPGFQNPPELRGKTPVFIGLQEPVEVLELATGEVWLPVIGQIVNVSGKPLSLLRWHFELKNSAGKVEFDRDLTPGFKLERSTNTLNEFLCGFPLPPDFRKGVLRIEATLNVGGRRGPLTHEVDVERVAGYTVASPVEGTWRWDNGPGEQTFHTHFHYPEQRYAYDIVTYEEANGRRDFRSGDPKRNESYFSWDQPIHSVQDGRVVVVIDNVPDNFGNQANPANNPRRNACILVEHAGRRFSSYFHVRRGSAAVKVGQRVKAGDVLGRVGNAGASSSPHLHFQYEVLDPSGRTRTVPVRIQGLRFADGRPADGVPKGRMQYLSTSATSGQNEHPHPRTGSHP
jgi:Peptidase family M23